MNLCVLSQVIISEIDQNGLQSGRVKLKALILCYRFSILLFQVKFYLFKEVIPKPPQHDEVGDPPGVAAREERVRIDAPC